MTLLLALLAACTPLKSGDFAVTFGGLKNNTCAGIAPTYEAESTLSISWPDKETATVTWDTETFDLLWPDDLGTGTNIIEDDPGLSTECVLLQVDEWVASSDGRDTLLLDLASTLDYDGSCGAHAESRPCTFGATFEGVRQ